MSDSFFNELEISEPNYNLNINSGLHGEQTGRMLIELEKVGVKERPDLIIVFGDTNSTLAGALVGAKLNIPVIHIEAGLRSFNREMPEEINRITSDHVSDFLFAPTENAILNLQKENLSERSYLTGDIMVDSLKLGLEKLNNFNPLQSLSLSPNEYYLLTLHRPYNVDDPKHLFNILDQLSHLSRKIIFPVHPRTRRVIEDYKISYHDNILITKPFGYIDFVCLQKNSKMILTDSGGIQKEAYILKIPCITLRSETEWIETVEAGWNLLLNPDTNDFAERISNFRVPDEYHDIFGVNVADKMGSLINKILQ